MPLQKLEDEVTHLQAVNSELVKDKEEALPLLDAYRSAHNSYYYSALPFALQCAQAQQLYHERNLLCSEV